MQRTKSVQRRVGAITACLAVLIAVTAGCHSIWNGWLDPSQVGRFRETTVSHDIRMVLSIQDEPPGVADASEPIPDDLTVRMTDYVMGPGDLIDVQVLDLLQIGIPYAERARINDLGYVTLTEVGQFKFGGKTAREAELGIIETLSDRLSRPQVRVLIQEERNRMFNVLGAVGRPGPYSILRPNFRLLDALALAGDFSPNIQELYVIRRVGAAEVAAAEISAVDPARTETGSPALLADMAQAGTPSTVSPPAVAVDETIAPDAQEELLEALEDTSGAGTPSEPVESGGSSAAGDGMGQWLWIDGEWVEVPQRGQTSAPGGEAVESPSESPSLAERTGSNAIAPDDPDDGIDWEALAEPEPTARVVAIPTGPLLAGESRYNIVIRNGDTIHVPVGLVGEYHMMGHVLRPGAYSITGREVTLKQAIADAGGLGPFGWPDRCEIVRRIGRDREQIVNVNLDGIFAGKEPDVFLRPNDIVNVGTHALAPFMATVRNSFRMAYGFGFVYDRNFADIDAYNSQANPKDRRRQEKAINFPPIFP